MLAESAKTAIVSCNHCDYAANVEKPSQTRRPADRKITKSRPRWRRFRLRQEKYVEVAEFLKLADGQIYQDAGIQTDDGEIAAALVRGDHEINELKLRGVLGCKKLFGRMRLQ